MCAPRLSGLAAVTGTLPPDVALPRAAPSQALRVWVGTRQVRLCHPCMGAESSWGRRSKAEALDGHPPNDTATGGHQHPDHDLLIPSQVTGGLCDNKRPGTQHTAWVGAAWVSLGEDPWAWHRDSADGCSDSHARLPTASTCPARLSFLLMSGPWGRCQEASPCPAHRLTLPSGLCPPWFPR